MLWLVAAAAAVSACGTTAADATDTSLPPGNAVAGAAATSLAKGEPVAKTASPAYRDVTIPAGTRLPLSLMTALESDTSVVEDRVAATLTSAVAIDGRDVLPAGTRMAGTVTAVESSGRVKGRAMIAFRFTSLRAGDQEYEVQSAPVSRTAAATKSKDATKVGIGAGAGAIVGGILGGKKGAAEGAAVGGGAGAGVVLATKGDEIRLAPGADVTSQLTAPLTIRVRVS
jgi:hypothetical protein